MKFLILLLFLFLGCGVQDYAPHIDPIWSQFSWAEVNKNGRILDYTTGVRQQPCHDCYIYSAMATLEIQYQIDHDTIIDLDLSEQEVHNCLKISCYSAGDTIYIHNYNRDFGAIEEKHSPEGDWKACRACDVLPRYSFDRWKQLIYEDTPYEFRREILVRAIRRGPIDIGIENYYDFRRVDGIFECPHKTGLKSSHFTTMIGYENNGEIIITKDSNGEIRRLKFEGGEECGFAIIARQIIPGSTYRFVGKSDFCETKMDKDEDGISDYYDNCYKHFNPEQQNTDGDILGDKCDPCINNPDMKCAKE